MHVYQLYLQLEEPLYYASRELGRSYQTIEYIHNYALTYALGLAVSEYHDHIQVPRYKEHLEPLNDTGVYITPAKPHRSAFESHTFKFADTRYHAHMEQSSVNIPTFGRAREVSTGSSFTAYAISDSPRTFPRWIRLGKWMSKTEVRARALFATTGEGPYVVKHVLNPLDLQDKPTLYDLINMPPVSLIDNARLHGKHLHIQTEASVQNQSLHWPEPTSHLPANCAYRFT
jgi:CRISPR-associated protein Csc1